MLAGLEAVDWESLDHAYGSAEDFPDLLRTIASGSAVDVDEAIDVLVGSGWHQGGVWPALVAAVPFLVEIVLEPTTGRVPVVGLLASLAEEDGGGIDKAVAAYAPRLMPLIDDADPRVRECAACLLAHTGPEDLVRPALARRWQIEQDPVARACVMRALVEVDPPAGRRAARESLADPRPAIRAAAGLCQVLLHVPWTDTAAEAVSSAFAEDDPLAGWVWSPDPLGELLDALPDPARAPLALLRLLIRSPSAQVRSAVGWVVSDHNDASRRAPPRLVPLLEPLLTDPSLEVRRAAIAAAARAGTATTLVADRLAAAAGALGGSDSDDPARRALAALIRIRDPRWSALLIAAWGMGSAADDVADLLRDSGVEPDADLVDGARARLRALDEPQDPTRRRSNRPASPGSERLALQRLLDHWGVEDLTPGLRESAVAGNLTAAQDLWRRTGDAGPWLESLAERLTQPHLPRAYLLRHVTELGMDAAPLLPALRAHLTGASQFAEARESQGVAAGIVWRLTGEPGDLLPILAELVGELSAEAIDTAGDLGTRAASLIPSLRLALADKSLNSSRIRLAAARALWRIGDREEDLVTPVLPRSTSWETADEALDLLVAMRATTALPRLRELLGGDERIRTRGWGDRAVSEDERICARLLEVIAKLEAE